VSAADITLASTRLADQRRHQVSLARKRMTWWIPLIFVAGLGVSVYGLLPAIAVFREGGSAALLALFAVFTVLFGWAVALWLRPLLFRPGSCRTSPASLDLRRRDHGRV
jgi:predicted permease